MKKIILLVMIIGLSVYFSFITMNTTLAHAAKRYKITYVQGDFKQTWVISSSDLEFGTSGVGFKFNEKYIRLYGQIRVEEE